ncbi:ArsA family ATPase [Chondrinema litorale]|uniref:ArsA family ATPase n=1 Tax=Chondrinema litorale TaxID=2994555 RepID=UPI0025439E94|nr:ArsA family ATPase [Chondrinema litorale]UZR92303.1 ArsA family ATPase [Chondrinema litorale]
MRIILFTGKGGTGKTTIAAATAYKAAREGYKTLVISTDPAHSLSDAVNQPLGAEPTLITENLYGQELDVYYSMKKYWGNMRSLMLQVFRWQKVDNILAEELSALPGMEEASAFLWIEKYYEEKEYDIIIIDSAPTGETLTLLTLPQVTKWWVTKAFPFQRTAIKTLGSVIRNVTGAPVDHGFEELENMFDKLEKVQKIFSKPEICSIRLVTNPERMVIQEAKRAYTYLQLYGYNVDAVVVNRILPEMDVDKTPFAKYITTQKKYLKEITDTFQPLPIFKVPHQGEEVFGLDLLKEIGEKAYDEKDPTEVFFQESPFKVEETKYYYFVKIRLPLLDDKEFKVNKIGDELIIQLANQRKNMFLPKFTNFYEMEDYKYDNPWLIVSFSKNSKKS